jgi:hypothetical protein
MSFQRIHIVGPPRSGTTLMYALFSTCFSIDGVTAQEDRLWRRMPRHETVLVTKYPGDEAYAPMLLPLDQRLWFVFMLRDPRDVIVSRHGKEPERYWSNLLIWQQAMRVHDAMRNHPRFVVVRYEDLVQSPDHVQKNLARRMEFLRPKIPFSEYHRNTPAYISKSEQMRLAMRGFRPVTACNVGGWRTHLPRVKAQVEAHGSLAERLIALGYEADQAWRQALEGVVPDRQQGVVPGRISSVKAAWLAFRRLRTAGIYLFRRYVACRFEPSRWAPTCPEFSAPRPYPPSKHCALQGQKSSAR